MSAPESHTTADAALSSLMGAVMGSPEYSRLVATSSSAQGDISQHDLRTTAGGRAYVAEYFVKRLGRHDFTRYISDTLAADFACTLTRHLASRPAPAAGDALELPGLNPDLIDILGRPNFTCIRIAQLLRLCGVEIAKKAEAEQATVIHYLLGFYLKHGSDWAARAGEDIERLRLAAIAAQQGKGGEA